MADITERIEKQLEGNNLALSAVAEILQKMDSRYSKDEEIAMAKAEEAQEAAERSSLIKEIATEVAGMLKADAGMDVDGTKVRSAAKTGKLPTNADDAEKPVTPTTKIEDQQATIQAMQKGNDEEESEDYPVEEKKGGMKYKAADDEEEDEDMDKQEDGEEEDEENVSKEGNGEADEDEEPDEMKAMAKQLNVLKKQVKNYEATMKKAIESESENRLRKMGFREENGLQAPKRFDPLGVDGTTRIQKAQKSAEISDQLADLSYKELRDLQVNIEQGKTDGVPRELLG